MKRIKTVAAIGGDRRQDVCASLLSDMGFFVSRGSIDAIPEADALLLPLPSRLCAADISRIIDAGISPVLCGKLQPEDAELIAEHGIEVIDYYRSEELTVKNADLTAEGAIFYAMQLLDRALSGASVLVLGYGRIGRLLTLKLSALGARVTVAARKGRDRAFALCEGAYAAIPTDEPRALLSGYDVLFNTVPAPLFDAETTAAADRRMLILDLASSSAFDIESAESHGLRFRHILSIPGKYAPESAGRMIAETVARYLNEINGRREGEK